MKRNTIYFWGMAAVGLFLMCVAIKYFPSFGQTHESRKVEYTPVPWGMVRDVDDGKVKSIEEIERKYFGGKKPAEDKGAEWETIPSPPEGLEEVKELRAELRRQREVWDQMRSDLRSMRGELEAYIRQRDAAAVMKDHWKDGAKAGNLGIQGIASAEATSIYAYASPRCVESTVEAKYFEDGLHMGYRDITCPDRGGIHVVAGSEKYKRVVMREDHNVCVHYKLPTGANGRSCHDDRQFDLDLNCDKPEGCLVPKKGEVDQ
jgi:hypothetical protein